MADSQIIEKLRSGCVIPAHPLALRPDRSIDQRRQRALTRYYLAAGARPGAVPPTQSPIHNPKIGLYRPVLELAIQTSRESAAPQGPGQPVMIAGILRQTNQALNEA